MFEHVVIRLHNTIPSFVMKIFRNFCTDETLHSKFTNFVLAFCILQKAADGFSANIAAAYRSIF